jgi:hypothetical protein
MFDGRQRQSGIANRASLLRLLHDTGNESLRARLHQLLKLIVTTRSAAPPD